MSEATPEAPSTEGTPEADTEAPAKETDWKAEARKWESRAKENKTAAERLAEIEEANKTAEEKAAERLKAAESRAADLEMKANRAEVAADKGVPAVLLSGSTREELEASADALIAFKGTTPSGPYVPAEGKHPKPQALNSDGLEASLRRAVGAN